jgi:hypothetical protein
VITTSTMVGKRSLNVRVMVMQWVDTCPLSDSMKTTRSVFAFMSQRLFNSRACAIAVRFFFCCWQVSRPSEVEMFADVDSNLENAPSLLLGESTVASCVLADEGEH